MRSTRALIEIRKNRKFKVVYEDDISKFDSDAFKKSVDSFLRILELIILIDIALIYYDRRKI